MRRFITVILLALALITAIPAIGPATTEAYSSNCNAVASQPYDNGPSVGGKGSFNCIYNSVLIVTSQVCLYRNGVAVSCLTKNYGGTTFDSYTRSVGQSNNGAYATYQTWAWIRDAQGNTEGSWSATAYLPV